jgi:hypothetical protein
MDYVVSDNLWATIIPLSAAVGAVAGLVWDIGNAVRRSTTEPSTGLDNIISLPRSTRGPDGTRSIELGFLGPMAVGAVAAILVVLLAGRSAPDAEQAATAISEVSASTSASSEETAQQVAEEGLGTQIDQAILVVLAIIGGLSGWPLLQAVTTRTSKLIEAAVGVALTPAGKNASQAVEEEAASLGLDEEKRKQLAAAAEGAVQSAMPAALQRE